MPEQQRLFRLLGRHPGADFDRWSAAALADRGPDRAEAVLEALVDAHLLQVTAAGRYTFHDLVREYAHRLAVPEPALGRARRRLHDYYLATATAATDLIAREARRFEPAPARPPRRLPPLPDPDAALAWLTAEHATLVALAAGTDDWQLACVLRAYFELRGHFADWRATTERALTLAADDPHATALLRLSLGGLAMWTGRLAEGIEQLRAAAAYGGDRQLQATALTSLGMVEHLAGRDTDAARDLHRALALDRSNPRTTALGWNNLALAEARLGRPDAAVTHHGRALALARRLGSTSALRPILLGVGETSLRLGRPAAEPFRQALALARAGGFRMQEALALDGLAHATGEQARWRQALSIYADLGVADRAELVRRHLAEPGRRWCDLCRAAPAPTDAGA